MMRMGFIFSEAFWGLFLIFLGVIMVLKITMGWNIPVFRVVVAFFLIYMGVSLLFGGNYRRNEMNNNTILFGDSKIDASNPAEKYDIIFSSGNIDLRGMKAIDKVTRMEVNTVFGSGVIHLNPDIPVVIKSDAAFASTRLPNGNQISFGDQHYRSGNFKEGEPYLEIHTSVVFGSLSILY